MHLLESVKNIAVYMFNPRIFLLLGSCMYSFILCRFVDGEDYFYAVSKALDEAKEEIYITDWW